MGKVVITCDSTCDLTPELYQKYQIQPIALSIYLGEQVYKDQIDVTVPELFAYADRERVLPKTTATSVGEYMDVFSAFREAGSEVVHISLSNRFSSCYQNATIAAKELGGVYTVDSLNLSSGSGHLAVLAAELRDQGMSAADIASELEEARSRLDVSFVLQTLDYLKMGGRCSGVAALGANLLKLRPEILVTGEGTMVVGKKYRGDMKRTITDYIKGRLEGRDDIQLNRIFITYSDGIPDEDIEEFKALVASLQPFKEIILTNAGCTIASHCGPRCLGVLFFRKKA